MKNHYLEKTDTGYLIEQGGLFTLAAERDGNVLHLRPVDIWQKLIHEALEMENFARRAIAEVNLNT